MLVIFEQDENKIVIQAESHDEAWEELLKYENLIIEDWNKVFSSKKSFFEDSQPKSLYSSVEELKKYWRFEASTTGKVVEFERGDIAFV